MNQRQRQPRQHTVSREEAGPGAPSAPQPAPTGSSLPATRPAGREPTTKPREENPVDVAAAFLAEKWGSMTRLGYTEFRKLGALIQSSFPEMGALEIVKFFDNLGGKPYDNAEFWLDQVAKHPATLGPPELVLLKPGTPEWNEWLDESLSAEQIPAAYLCRLYRSDRDAAYEEVGYATAKDAVLYDYEWVEVPNVSSRLEAAKAEPNADKMFFDRDEKKWKARIPTPKLAYVAEAKKTARTRAIRRCAKRAYSLTEAKYIRVAAEVEDTLEELHAEAERAALPPGRQDVKSALRQLFRCQSCDPPVELLATELEAHRKQRPGHNSFLSLGPEGGLPERKPEPKRSPEGKRYISGDDHRRLHAWANERDYGGEIQNPHEMLKLIIAEIRGQPDTSGINTTEITYAEWEQVREALEKYPLRPSDAEDAEAMVVKTRPPTKAEQPDLLDQ